MPFGRDNFDVVWGQDAWCYVTDKRALLLHLVNASGHFGQREVAPVPMHDAEVVLPFEGEPASVTALVGEGCGWSAADGRLAIRIPELGMFEALVIGRP
jgi:hypothetical protein